MHEAADMYSNAKIAGHPIHPMVVVFPIALYTATVAALLAYVGTADPFYYRGAMVTNIAGVAMALIATIPGALDLFALPRFSRARAIAIRHASFAILTTGIFAASGALLYRGWVGRMMVDGRWDLDATIPLAVGVVGLVTLLIVGALGWTLIQTHHVGIKPALVKAHVPSREPELEDSYDDLLPTPTLPDRPIASHITLH